MEESDLHPSEQTQLSNLADNIKNDELWTFFIICSLSLSLFFFFLEGGGGGG